MKDSIILGLVISLILLFIVCVSYKNQIKREYERGIVIGKKECEMKGIDSIPFNGKSFDSMTSKIIVDSITFKYDSIMVIHYNQSEVK